MPWQRWTPEEGPYPIALQTDREAVAAALKTIRPVAPKEARVVHIRNTLRMRDLDISEALLPEAQARKDLEVIRKWGPFHLTKKTSLNPSFSDSEQQETREGTSVSDSGSVDPHPEGMVDLR